MRFSYMAGQESSMKKTILIIASILLLISISQSVLGANQIIVQGFVTGDCVDANANVSIIIYSTGNPGNVVDTQWLLINISDDSYDKSSNPIPAGTYDAQISINNPLCSPSVSDTRTETGIVVVDLAAPTLVSNLDLAMSASFIGTTPADGANTDNQTQFYWTNDYVQADSYTLEIATTSGFGGTIVRTQSGIATGATPGYKLTAPQELADGTYYWRVHVVNITPSIFDTTTTKSFTVISGEAIISNPSPANNSWTTSASYTITTDVAATCRWSLTSSTYNAKTAFTTTGGTTHSTTLTGLVEGTNTIYILCNASFSGVVNTAEFVRTIRRDTIGPVVSNVVIDAGATYSTDTNLALTWSGTDAGVGSITYYYSLVNGAGAVGGTTTGLTSGTISGVQGLTTVYVWAKDSLNNFGSAASDSITIDTLPPVFTTDSHTSITKYSAGVALRATVRISDTSPYTPPVIRYRMNNNSWSSWYSMSVSTPNNYMYDIPEGAGSGLTWFENSGNTAYYEVNVSDMHGFANNISRFEFINNESTAPTFDSISDQVVDEDSSVSIILSGTDADLDQLTFTCNISGATITRIDNYQSTLYWLTDNDDIGSNTFICNVTDGIFTVNSNSFTISVTNVNDAPVLSAIGNLYAQEYEFFNYTFNASDIDGDTLRYYSNNSILPINSWTAEVGFTPFSMHRGVYPINISVTDGNGGYDNEEITFTVGYCGDNVCTATYEDCDICAIDCGICGEKESKAIVLDQPRNCYGRDVLLQAVKLVERATCEEEGDIIDSMEVCGPLSSTSLQVLLKIDTDLWEEVSQISTDELGYASFSPLETGNYKVAFLSDRDMFTLFEVEMCSNVNLDGDETETTVTKPSTSNPSLPPLIEEPSLLDDIKSKWTFFSAMLYFLIIPIIFVAIVIGGMGFVYRLEKSKHHENTYVKHVDKWLAEYQSEKKKARSWMQKTSPFKEMLVYWDKSLVSILKAAKFVKDISLEAWSKFIITIGLRRTIRIPYLAQKKKGQHKHLLLVSLIKNAFPHKNADIILNKVKVYAVSSLYDLAAMLMSQGVKVQLVDTNASDIKYLNILISKGMTFRSRAPTRVDVETALQNGKAVVALVNELGDNNTIIQSMVVVCGFDKYQFYYHNYDRQLKDVAVTKDQFMHSWKAAGFKGIILQ